MTCFRRGAGVSLFSFDRGGRFDVRFLNRRGKLAPLHPRFFRGRPCGEIPLLHPERNRRAKIFLVEFEKFHHRIIPRVTGKVVQSPHVNAGRRTGLRAKGTKKTLRIIDCKTRQLGVFPAPGVVDVDAVDRARLRTKIARNTLVGFKFMNATITGRKVELLFRVLDGHRFGKAIAKRDRQPRGDGFDRLNDVCEVVLPHEVSVIVPCWDYRGNEGMDGIAETRNPLFHTPSLFYGEAGKLRQMAFGLLSVSVKHETGWQP